MYSLTNLWLSWQCGTIGHKFLCSMTAWDARDQSFFWLRHDGSQAFDQHSHVSTDTRMAELRIWVLHDHVARAAPGAFIVICIRILYDYRSSNSNSSIIWHWGHTLVVLCCVVYSLQNERGLCQKKCESSDGKQMVLSLHRKVRLIYVANMFGYNRIHIAEWSKRVTSRD